ncbi:hypothetical protein PTSG_11291 [Salpingoeca rosetta]|uniref:COG4 transport protein middle alpha-helical bundle domain-containing protein n=1 Tax=Salpingoeca rosetta (strain ATCC 50818 / BSB-021) TaxID=946362 RepID=F2USZ7_SALR5|nr:uncharacterized protein PTSG_11291 [Salpingoeca rosetta]EGD81256.1 hypothetical protein PTSG_11291 [Salpingoeca rosetta]|eukprot:XP_004987652.1 hypothetical protein PTSG_11291 [Salpingoeca rosetta]
MIHAHDEGLQQVKEFLQQRISTQPAAASEEETDTESDTQFVNRIKRLLNRVAEEIEGFLASIDTHFGPGYTFQLLSELQLSIDACALAIVDEFVSYRQLEEKAQTAEEDVDPQLVDTIASELAFVIQPLALFMRFVDLRAETDVQAYMEAESKGEATARFPDGSASAGNIRRSSKLSRRTDELNAFYVVLEQKFLKSSVNMALCEDELDTSQEFPITKAVEDVLFICQKCTRRAFLTVSEVTTSSTLNHVGTCMIEDLLSYLEQRMLNAANKKVDAKSWQGQLQRGLSLATRGAAGDDGEDEHNIAALPRHVWVNDLQLFLELVPKYKSATAAANERLATRWSSQEHNKLMTVIENNVQEAVEVAQRYRDVGVDKLASSSVSSKLKGLINLLPYADFDLSEAAFDDMDDTTEGMYTLIAMIEATVEEHKGVLLPGAFSAWAIAFTEKIASALETKIIGGKYNLLGGLQLEKDMTELSTRVSDAVMWPVTDRFHRINRMCLLLTLDRVHAVYDYYDAGAANWNLSPDEVVSILTRRVDFDAEDLDKLKI